eukprot:scaffold12876_cov21-Tisochrysis_lutea.AAC.3
MASKTSDIQPKISAICEDWHTAIHTERRACNKQMMLGSVYNLETGRIQIREIKVFQVCDQRLCNAENEGVPWAL